jgi:[pyruvate, water dikinase]-phosphate phosphotransferase / [pyruvate, water dikinase] kinase
MKCPGLYAEGMKRTVFLVSDRTGITVEALSRSLLSQFDHIPFDQVTLPFIDTLDKARQAAQRIRQTARDGVRPLVFSSLTDPEARAALADSGAFFLDLFDTFIEALERELGARASGEAGKSHGMGANYGSRMEALNFALAHDDGVGSRLDRADVILVGVSRSGKTPACLYLALHYGLRAANYPLTEEDLARPGLPPLVAPYRERLFGLTLSPERLALIRQERRPGSRYAELATCQGEVRQAESLFRAHRIPFLDTGAMSVEEIASSIAHPAR